MMWNYKLVRNAALSFVMAGGMAGFTTLAQAHVYTRSVHIFSRSEVRAAQQQLKNDGYYKGRIDGIDGPMTMAAIRNYQRDNNLAVSGQLDSQTRDQLGISQTGQASRQGAVPSSNTNGTPSSNTNGTPSSSTSGMTSSNTTAMNPPMATVKAAQQKLQDAGFYKGTIDGTYNSETRAAIREYQQNSGLNVSGQLDQQTLSSLGVSK
jgi:mannosyl-glycoprotein endo-beta-N-acetylglucosaminidase